MSDLEERTILFNASREELNTERNNEEYELDSIGEEEDQQTSFIQDNERHSDFFDFDEHLIPLTLTETQRRPTHLEKKITFLNGLTLVLGTMIGSGIFASPGPVVKNAGSVGMSLVVWLICGLLACTGALTYAELGTEIPISGGEHAYLSHAYGSLPAFLFSWTAITSVIFAEYLNRIIYHTAFDDAKEHPTAATHKWLNKIVAILCVITVSLINTYSVRLATRTQDLFTAVKMFSLAVIAVIGFVVLGKGGRNENFDEDLFYGTSTKAGDYALAFYSERDLPRVIMVGLPLVIIFYLLANVAYYAVLPSSIVIQTNTIALDFGREMFGPVGGILFALCVAASCFGAANGGIFTGSRLIYVAGREGYLPTVFGKVHSTWNTPTAALIMQAVLTIVFIIPGSFTTLLNFVSVAGWVFYFLTSFGLFILRWREPNLERPYKVWLTTPLIFCCVAVFLIVMPFVKVPLESLAALCFILAGIPFWYVRVKYKESFTSQAIKDYVSNINIKVKTWRLNHEYFKQEIIEQ
ncbi:2419_t:CDS:2 [Diversispora eburnea]|uniref:2419_t:CDS:1 n=1 Tax=Diversispora eburnea TaxID=1213867 RepID=A0A9N9G200_9GLOM|nr:2419_t:CDS:2 [Diversispora eburnea]